MDNPQNFVIGGVLVLTILLIAINVYFIMVALKMKKSQDKDLRKHGGIFLGVAITYLVLTTAVLILKATENKNKKILMPINLIISLILLYIIFIGLKLRKYEKFKKHGSILVYLVAVPLSFSHFKKTKKSIKQF